MVKQYKHVEWPPFHGIDGFNGVLHDRKCDLNLQKQSPALGLIQLSQDYKGNCHLICFAPLTNVALAMKVDAEFAGRLNGIYGMGGNLNAEGNASISAEFNFLADPEAAHVVLQCTKLPILLAPWELCGKDLIIPMVIEYLYYKFSAVFALAQHVRSKFEC